MMAMKLLLLRLESGLPCHARIVTTTATPWVRGLGRFLEEDVWSEIATRGYHRISSTRSFRADEGYRCDRPFPVMVDSGGARSWLVACEEGGQI